MKTIKVRCILDIDVEVPSDMDDHQLQFAIEENSCPGTSWVGSAIRNHMEKFDEGSYCWACALNGTNMILQNRVSDHENR